jgi:SAM-dependent methyltransferase
MKSHRFIPKTKVVERIEALLELARNKDVLHIGLGGFVENTDITNRYIKSDLNVSVHCQLAQVAAKLTGLDINQLMVKAMQEAIVGDYIVADITDKCIVDKIRHKFDVVLFPEVIEHLDDFRSALNNIRKILNSDGILVITTINAFCADTIGKMIFRYESVHEEHTCYFSYRTLKRLLEINGYKVETFFFCNERRNKFSSNVEKISYYNLLFLSHLLPQFSEGIIVCARPVR